MKPFRTGPLIGGVSRQPHTQQFRNQTRESDNVVHDVAVGARKRNGTVLGNEIENLEADENYRLHPIDRGPSEKYILLYGDVSGTMTFRIFTMVGNGLQEEGTITLGTGVQTYLDTNDPSADDFAIATVQDTTLICNRTVETGTSAAATYTVTTKYRDWYVMISDTPTDDTYHQALFDTPDGLEQEGFGYYDVDSITFCTASFDTPSTGDYLSPGGDWDNLANTDRGFRVAYQREALTVTSTLQFTTSTKKLDSAGNDDFAGYTFQSGDYIKITGGTGVNADWYEIVGKDSDDQIELAADIGGSDPTDVTAQGFGIEVDCVVPPVNRNDMEEVASDIQDILRQQTGLDALCHWSATGANFKLTSPYRGSGAATIEVSTLAGGANDDLTASNKPFDSSSIDVTAGTGTPSDLSNPVLALEDRWTRVSESGETDNKPDPAKFPVKLERAAVELASQSITNITAAAAAVVTAASHGLITGQTVTISSSNSTPDIDGDQVVTVLSANTFSVPVTTSGSGSSGSFTAKAHFTMSQVDWNSRPPTDTPTLNPSPQPFMDGYPIRDLKVYRERLAVGCGPYVVYGQSGDLFNFFADDGANIVDSDPIVLPLAGDSVSDVEWLAVADKTLVVFTASGVQLEINAPEALTPSTASFRQTTKHDVSSIAQPASVEGRIYFGSDQSNRVIMHEYHADHPSAATSALEITSHIEDYVPKGIRRVTANGDENMVFVLLDGSDTSTDISDLYCYRAFWQGGQKVQSAWAKFDFDDNYEIRDVCVLGNDLYMLVETTNDWVFERLPLDRQDPETGYPYVIHLDRMVELQGVLNGSDTDFTLPIQANGSTINALVLGPGAWSGGKAAGDVYINGVDGITFTYGAAPSDVVTVDGEDLTDQVCMLGRFFGFTLQLAQPYIEDERTKEAMLFERAFVSDLIVNHEGSNISYTVLAEQSGRGDREKEYDSTRDEGFTRACFYGPAWEMTYSITDSTPKPLIITSAEFGITGAEDKHGR